MTDKREKTPAEKQREANVKTDYYDKVDEKEHERSAENTSVADPASRDLWQSTNVSTDGSGPNTEDVAPVFAQTRADALAHPTFADDADVDDEDRERVEEAAEDAQEEADEVRARGGYAAPTGAEAGIYDDEADKDSIAKENFNAEPKGKDDERNAKAEAKKEQAKTAGAKNVATDGTERRAPAKAKDDEKKSDSK